MLSFELDLETRVICNEYQNMAVPAMFGAANRPPGEGAYMGKERGFKSLFNLKMAVRTTVLILLALYCILSQLMVGNDFCSVRGRSDCEAEFISWCDWF